MMKGQICLSQGNINAARESYRIGVKNCSKSVPLWLMSSRLEESQDMVIKSRALLDKARGLNPKQEELWLETINIEQRAGTGQEKNVLAKALQECPNSGLLWSEAIWLEPRTGRKSKSTDALKKTNNHPVVVCTVARLFWSERKPDKARSWFGRSVEGKEHRDLGDNWGWWYKFELQNGTKEQQSSVMEKCKVAEPKHGPAWQSINKTIENNRKPVEEILKLVADKLKNN